MRIGSFTMALLAIGVLFTAPSLSLKADSSAFFDGPVPPRPITHAAHIPGNDTPEGKKIRLKLISTILDKVDFDKLDLLAVIDFLNAKSKELDPEHIGVRFFLHLPPTSVQPFHRALSITLTEVSLSDLLEYVTQQANLTYRIEKGGVVISPIEYGHPTTPAKPTAN